jgi:hypothetical protein
MISTRLFLAAVGFAFVAVWIGTNFGDAVLCLVGAVVFYIAGIYLEGVIDVDELRERLTSQTARRQPASTFRRSSRSLG